MASFHKVQLLTCPLKFYTEWHLQQVDVWAKVHKLHHVPFVGLQHWALQVGPDDNRDYVFEVTSNGAADHKPTFRKIARSEWWQDHEYNADKVQSKFLGITFCTFQRIEEYANYIWSAVFDQNYVFATTNCQTFVGILHALIIERGQLRYDLRAQLDLLPTPLNPILLTIEKAKQVSNFIRSPPKTLSRRTANATKPASDMKTRLPARLSRSWLDSLRGLHTEQEDGISNQEGMYDILWHTKQKHQQRQCESTRRRLSICIVGRRAQPTQSNRSSRALLDWMHEK
jgi:hypothetical protein